MKKSERGNEGERCASVYLKKKKYTLLTANFRTRFGEIDIIAQNKQYIIFVEVKTRGKNSLGLPRDAVDIFKQRKIMRTAMIYLNTHPSSLQPRFDVIEIITEDGNFFKAASINHIENAFGAEVLHEAF